MADCNGTSGLSILIQSLIIEQNVDRICLFLVNFQSNKAICNAKKFRKSNRQYLETQQTVLCLPDSPCQTVLKFPETHARQFWICSALYSPLQRWKFYVSFLQLWLKFSKRPVQLISILTTIHVVGHKWRCHQLQIVSGQPWILEGPLCSANGETRRTSNTRNQHWILCPGSRSQVSVCKLSAGMFLSDHKRIYNVWHKVSCML